MFALAALSMLAFAALFIPMILMMVFRERLSGRKALSPARFIVHHGISAAELSVLNLLLVLYVLKPAISEDNFGASALVLAGYCILCTVSCMLLVCLEWLIRKCINSDTFLSISDAALSAIKKTAAGISSADEAVFRKIRCHIDELIAFAFIITAAGLMLNRAFYGTEITDEAYYYADALSVLQGNLPYAYNNSSAVGMTLLMLIPMAVYRLVQPDMVGLFLYMRICYVVFKLLAITLIYFLLRKTLNRRKLLWVIAILLPYLGGIYQSFSYNTVGKYMVLISGILIACALGHDCRGTKKEVIMLFTAGFLSAIGVFAHPLQAASVSVLAILLFLYRKGSFLNRLKGVVLYSLGGFTEILIVLIPISMLAGSDTTYSGIHELLFGQSTMRGTFVHINFSDRWNELINAYGHDWKIMTAIAIVPIAILSLMRMVSKVKWTLRDQLLLAGSISFITICLCKKFDSSFTNTIGGLILWLAFLFPLIRKEKLFAFAALPFIAFFTAELMLVKNGGVRMRSVFLYPILFVWLFTAFQSRKILISAVSVAVSVVATVSLIKSDYASVYRDSPIKALTYRVPDGIYKGIYTTEQRGRDLMELEKYIAANTGPDEKVQFRDNTPAAYLMHTQGGVSDVRTWDCMQFSYRNMFHTNNPQIMYRYYKRTNSIPDKIIYVDFGRDAILSIEDPKWKYNKFVNTYYDKQSEVRLNKTFRVLVYKYNGNFDGNYDRWIQSVE